MPLRLREHGRHGYAGFEARYYSLFPTYGHDMAAAVNLQQFLLALSYQMALRGDITHQQIPDDPNSESERRQPFFFSAAGLPAFYVQKDSRNGLLRRHLALLQEIASQPASSGICAHFHSRLSPGSAGFCAQDRRRVDRGDGHAADAGRPRHTLRRASAGGRREDDRRHHRQSRQTGAGLSRARFQSHGGNLLSRYLAAAQSGRSFRLLAGRRCCPGKVGLRRLAPTASLWRSRAGCDALPARSSNRAFPATISPSRKPRRC